jgi:hypothetical protein
MRSKAMPTYLLTHHFPQNYQGSPQTAAAATAWFERLGSNLVGRSDRRLENRQLGNCGTHPEPPAYTLLSTDTLEAAIALAEAWPLLARGGGIEVRELTSASSVPRASA